jgi:hypothetical protein
MTKYGIVIVSRDRTDMLPYTIPAWLEQKLPIVIMTEPDQAEEYRFKLHRLVDGNKAKVVSHKQPNMGVGYARESAVKLAHRHGIDAFIMADDDTIPVKGNVRSLLNFVNKRKAIVCAGWMPNYGIWVRNGNQIAKQPGLVVARGGAPDRIFAINTNLCLNAGNFDPNLTTLDTQELNRLGMKAGYLWYVSTSVHIRMLNKPQDPGGIQSFTKTPEERAAQNRRDHEYTFKKWGPRYISEPPKRMATRWLRLAEDFVGSWAVEAIREATVYEEAAVQRL